VGEVCAWGPPESSVVERRGWMTAPFDPDGLSSPALRRHWLKILRQRRQPLGSKTYGRSPSQIGLFYAGLHPEGTERPDTSRRIMVWVDRPRSWRRAQRKPHALRTKRSACRLMGRDSALRIRGASGTDIWIYE